MGLSEPNNRFVDAELILRSIAFTSHFDHESGSIPSYSGKMKGFLNWFMNKNKHCSTDTIRRYHEKFEQSLNSSYAVFGDKAFRKIDSKTLAADRLLNRAIYDAVMVGFSNYETDAVTKKKQQIVDLFTTLPDRDEKFSDAITYGTSDKVKVEYRIKRWCEELAIIMK